MISVIIPTLNAAGVLPDLLKLIASEDKLEVLVIDSSSDDNTVEIAQSHGVEVLKIARDAYDHGVTRTYGAMRASGEYLVFLSQDVMPVSRDSLGQLIQMFEADPEIAAVYGRQLPTADASFFAKHLRWFNYPDRSNIRTLADRANLGLKAAFLSNSFSAYRKKDLEEIDFFKRKIIFGEDMYAASRLLLKNKKIAYCAEAEVYHSHNYSIVQDFQRYFDMGVFHALEKDLLREFGTPEKQGGKYFRFELKSILAEKRCLLLPVLFFRSIAKYIGYKMGRNHRFIPKWLNRKIGMNHAWWSRKHIQSVSD